MADADSPGHRALTAPVLGRLDSPGHRAVTSPVLGGRGDRSCLSRSRASPPPAAAAAASQPQAKQKRTAEEMQRASAFAIKLVELLREGQGIGESDHENAAALEAIEVNLPPITTEKHVVESVGAWRRQRQETINDIHALYRNTVVTRLTLHMYNYREKLARRKLVGYYEQDKDQHYDAEAAGPPILLPGGFTEKKTEAQEEKQQRNEEQAKLLALDQSPMIRLIALDKNAERAKEKEPTFPFWDGKIGPIHHYDCDC